MERLKNTVTLIYFIALTTSNAFGQRYYDEDYEDYNWSEFDGEEFFYSAVICAVIIVVGLLIRKNSNNSFLKGLGTTIIVIGSIGAFGMLGGPILGAVQIIWQVVVGAAIFFGIIYWVYTEIIDKE